MSDDAQPQRRSSDVDPATKLYVRDEVSETRHLLRQDIAALATKVELFMAQSTKEHSEVAGKLDRLSEDVAELKPLTAKVAALELADATAEARALEARQMREQSRRQFQWIVATIIAAVGVIVAALALFT